MYQFGAAERAASSYLLFKLRREGVITEMSKYMIALDQTAGLPWTHSVELNVGFYIGAERAKASRFK